MIAQTTIRLHESIAAVCPIDGVAVDGATTPPTVRIDYKSGATQPQRTAAQSAVAAFDWSDAAQTTWEADSKPERKALRAASSQAIIDNDAFLALASPSNAQVLAQVKALTRQSTRLIQRLIQVD